jgi:2-keto-4-pentenoate hydratase
MPTISTDARARHTKLIRELAEQLRRAEAEQKPCPPIRNRLPSGDLDLAYAIQDANTKHWIKQGRRLVGRKIGLTARSVQQQLGVDQPDFGMLFADMAIGDGEEMPLSRVMQPKAEAEIAFILERDLLLQQTTPADVIRSTAYVVPAIEVVGSRIANWDIKITDTVADNASSGLFILGTPPRRLDGLDLANCRMTMRRKDETISSGIGAACLGHPINAVTWLARTMAKAGRPLRAGDVVMSGALGPMAAIRAGDAITADIEGVGSVRANFL